MQFDRSSYEDLTLEEVDPPKKKRRISAACSECKKKHSKCNGLQPCDKCILQDKHCVYIPQRKRGAKPRSRSDIAFASFSPQFREETPTFTRNRNSDPFLVPESLLTPISATLDTHTQNRWNELLTTFRREILPYFPAFKAPNFSVVVEGSDIDFLLSVIFLNASVFMDPEQETEQLSIATQSKMTWHLLRAPSIPTAWGLLLLAYYFSARRIEQGFLFAQLSYRLSQRVVITLNNQSELSELQGCALSFIVRFAYDVDDRDYLFSKAKKLLTQKTDLLLLHINQLRNQIARYLPQNDPQFLDNFDSHFAAAYELFNSFSRVDDKVYRSFANSLDCLRAHYLLVCKEDEKATALATEVEARLERGRPFNYLVDSYVLKTLLHVYQKQGLLDRVRHVLTLLEDKDSLTEEEISDFANEVSRLLSIIAPKHILECDTWKWIEKLFLERDNQLPFEPHSPHFQSFVQHLTHNLFGGILNIQLISPQQQ
eukprot:TRINITY_DN676_c0_g1_i1.p1 TRINITY_DN676_c0_g1~~TRINITY_DN676_c0_g1_i1.p1  ORF type:complete len:485 (-),score=69.78 TRINITY_DN676_c0_g1_i1:59-1513(-)